MTTPNEELRKQLQQIYKSGELYYRAISDTTDLLQSQAERIASLEDDVEYLQEDIDAMCNAIPGYRWSGGAAELIAECFAERDELRAQLAAIRAQEPELVVEKEPDYWSGGHFHEGSKPHIKPTKVWCLPIGTKLFTHPMPAQGVNAELVYALQCAKNSLVAFKLMPVPSNAWEDHDEANLEVVNDALSKYKGAKQ